MQEQTEEENNCGKIKTCSNELVFHCSGKFLIREKSDYILRSGETHSLLENRQAGRDEIRDLTKPNSQVKLKDVYFGGLMDHSAEKPFATEVKQVLREFSESESWSVHEDEVTGKLVAYKKGAEKPAASSISENSGNSIAERNGHISTCPLKSCLTWERKAHDRGPVHSSGEAARGAKDLQQGLAMGYNREQRPDAALDVLSAGTAQAREEQGDSTTTTRLHQTCGPVNQLRHVCVEKCPLTTRHVATRTLRGQLREERVLITLEKALAGARPGGQSGNTTIQSRRVNDRGKPSPKRGAERSFRTDLRGLPSDVQKWTTRGTAEPRPCRR